MSQDGFLTRNIAGLSAALESVVLNEELARSRGLVQSLDPRVKIVSFISFIVIAALARSLWLLAGIFILALLCELSTRINPGFFLKRVLLFLPLSAIIALPALFITPGEDLLRLGGRLVITVQGAHTAGFLLLRVMDSVSFGLLLILTTPWNRLLIALRWFRLPGVVVDLLALTYRYIFLFLHTANGMFLARRSRSLGVFSGAENRRWLGRALAMTMAKTQHLSEEVYLAMLSRGYQGEILSLEKLKMRSLDLVWLLGAGVVAALLLWSIYR